MCCILGNKKATLKKVALRIRVSLLMQYVDLFCSDCFAQFIGYFQNIQPVYQPVKKVCKLVLSLLGKLKVKDEPEIYDYYLEVPVHGVTDFF